MRSSAGASGRAIGRASAGAPTGTRSVVMRCHTRGQIVDVTSQELSFGGMGSAAFRGESERAVAGFDGRNGYAGDFVSR